MQKKELVKSSLQVLQNYKNTDEYNLLVEDSQAILTEGIFRSRQELIDCYKELGERIYTDPLYKKWGQKTQGKFMQELANDIGNSARVVYYSIQFYERLTNDKDFCTAVQNLGKNASWTKIRELLPPQKEDKIILPKGKFNVLLADPAWEYRNSGVEGAAEKEYPTMSIEKLCAMSIKELTTENAVLFLWVTNPLLEECFEVIKNWGFQYKTNFVWYKKNKKTGIGFYVRGVHELLLICVKGQMLPDYTPLSIIQEDSGEHSKKPEIYEIIEKMYPNQKYLELFARDNKMRKDWSYWGNESNQ